MHDGWQWVQPMGQFAGMEKVRSGTAMKGAMEGVLELFLFPPHTNREPEETICSQGI